MLSGNILTVSVTFSSISKAFSFYKDNVINNIIHEWPVLSDYVKPPGQIISYELKKDMEECRHISKKTIAAQAKR